jgi:hypothetical protein
LPIASPGRPNSASRALGGWRELSRPSSTNAGPFKLEAGLLPGNQLPDIAPPVSTSSWPWVCCHSIAIPLHTVIELTPHAYGCHETRMPLKPQLESREAL